MPRKRCSMWSRRFWTRNNQRRFFRKFWKSRRVFCMRMPPCWISVATNRSIFRILKVFPFRFRRSSSRKTKTAPSCGTSWTTSPPTFRSPLCRTSLQASWCLRLGRRIPRRVISICSVPPARSLSPKKTAPFLIRLSPSAKNLRLLLTTVCATRNRSMRLRMLSVVTVSFIRQKRWSMSLPWPTNFPRFRSR